MVTNEFDCETFGPIFHTNYTYNDDRKSSSNNIFCVYADAIINVHSTPTEVLCKHLFLSHTRKRKKNRMRMVAYLIYFSNIYMYNFFLPVWTVQLAKYNRVLHTIYLIKTRAWHRKMRSKRKLREQKIDTNPLELFSSPLRCFSSFIFFSLHNIDFKIFMYFTWNINDTRDWKTKMNIIEFSHAN